MKSKLLILFLFCWFGSFGQTVPDTNTFSLWDVLDAVQGNHASGNLYDAFSNSVAGKFDTNYGSKYMNPKTMLGFRNYGNVVTYWNTYQECTASRNDCSEGYYSPETYTGHVDANTYSSLINQADANAQAQAACQSTIQAYANAHGSCVPIACLINIETVYACGAVTGESLSVDCDGSYSISFTYDISCTASGIVYAVIADENHQYLGMEVLSGSWSGQTFTANGTLSIALANGYYVSIEHYL